MTIRQAKESLKKYGSLDFRGVSFRETVRMRNNWYEYTGRYIVTPDGHDAPVNLGDSASLTKAFEIAKPYFQ